MNPSNAQRLGRAALAVALGTAGAVAGVATPAHANDDDVPSHVTTVTGPAVAELQVATATCPDGEYLFGGGGRVDGGGRYVALVAILPDPTTGTLTVRGRARPGYIGAWSVTAVAICSDIGPVPVLRSTGTDNASTTSKETTAECDRDEALYGSGFEIRGGAGSAYLTSLIPDDASPVPQSVSAQAWATPAAAGTWSLAVHAVCATRVGNMFRSEGSTGRDGGSPKTATTYLSDPNVHGVGGAVVGAPLNAFLTALVPTADYRAVEATGSLSPPLARLARIAGPGTDEFEVDAYATEATYY